MSKSSLSYIHNIKPSSPLTLAAALALGCSSVWPSYI